MKTTEEIYKETEMVESVQRTLEALNRVRHSKDPKVVLKHARAALYGIYTIQSFAPQDEYMVHYIQNMVAWAESQL